MSSAMRSATRRVFYNRHAEAAVHAIIGEEMPAGFELVTLDADRDEERRERIAGAEVAVVAGRRLRGDVIAAALDVFEQEPPPASEPLFGMRNVVVTPHISAGTRDALATKMRALFANVYAGGRLDNEVHLGTTAADPCR